MPKKLITACMALVAFAAPALGSASASATNTPSLTAPAGTVAAVGSTIVGTSVDPLFLGTEGTSLFTCVSAKLTGEVTKNSGGNVEGNITSATFVGSKEPITPEPDKACTGIFNASVTATTPWCLRSTTTMKTNEFQLRGGKCSEAAKTIVIHLVAAAPAITCTYERTTATGPITGTSTTLGSPAIVAFHETSAGSGFVRSAGSSAFCPSSITLRLTFTLENGSGQAAVLD
jgi:hypothetical protein